MSLIDFLKNNHLQDSDEIIFYGGSFHPWHEGHSECIRLLKKDTPLIVILDHNPHKELDTEKDIDILKIRKTISLLRENTFLYEEFFHLNQKNPTATWINELKKQVNSKLSLLMGFDSFQGLESWTSANSLIKSLSALYIASRLENEKTQVETTKKIHKINPKLEINFLGHHPFEKLSSTELR